MKLLRILPAALFTFLLLFLSSPLSTYAATFRHGDTITITQPLKDLYITGGTIDVASDTKNDLTVAGGTIDLEGSTSNDVLAAGGNVTLTGNVGNTARVAGGTIRVQGPITNDLVVAGGTIDITKEASVGGDLVITGGTIRINAPIKGNIWITGGNVEINNTVGGNVWGGEIGELHLGPKAVINGDLNYTADQKASIANGATIHGKQNFKQQERSSTSKKEAAGTLAGIVTAGAIYKLLAGILVSFLFIWLLPKFFTGTNKIIVAEPLKTGFLGFGVLILMPVISLMLFIFIWLGIASLLLYFLLLILSVIVTNIFTGWWLLKWWYDRDKKAYNLDWKAAVAGPLALTILAFIPIIGWLISFILWLLGIGALATQLWNFVNLNRYPATAHNGHATHPTRVSPKKKN